MISWWVSSYEFTVWMANSMLLGNSRIHIVYVQCTIRYFEKLYGGTEIFSLRYISFVEIIVGRNWRNSLKRISRQREWLIGICCWITIAIVAATTVVDVVAVAVLAQAVPLVFIVVHCTIAWLCCWTIAQFSGTSTATWSCNRSFHFKENKWILSRELPRIQGNVDAFCRT